VNSQTHKPHPDDDLTRLFIIVESHYASITSGILTLYILDLSVRYSDLRHPNLRMEILEIV
jgi:hypothetical protein